MGEIKIPKYKKIASYFTDVILESFSNDYHEYIDLRLSKGRLQLNTPNAIYSYDDLYLNFTNLFEKMDLDDIPGNDVLILGTGLASVPLILEEIHHKLYNYTCVDIDEDILMLASKYTLPKLDSHFEMIHADAEIFIQFNERKYDLIVIDIFWDNIIPSKFSTEKFLISIRNSLTQNGIVIWNRLATTPETTSASKHIFKTVFKKVFPEAKSHRILHNYMILNK